RENQYLGMDLSSPNPDFIQLGQGFGLPTIRTETREALKSVLQTRWSDRRGPMLIEAILSDTPPT
ncbi:MAG: hypothetical protein VYC71_01265, partial [Planctomycetota bacterium]|nr:hypothetical protein [Planctomycetota bacterium]